MSFMCNSRAARSRADAIKTRATANWAVRRQADKRRQTPRSGVKRWEVEVAARNVPALARCAGGQASGRAQAALRYRDRAHRRCRCTTTRNGNCRWRSSRDHGLPAAKVPDAKRDARSAPSPCHCNARARLWPSSSGQQLRPSCRADARMRQTPAPSTPALPRPAGCGRGANEGGANNACTPA